MPANVRAVTKQDLPSVLRIAATSPEAAQWSQESYLSLLDSVAEGWVAAEGRAVVGFLILRQVAGDAEILNVAVLPAARRKGIGSNLLREALRWANKQDISKIHLEVRASNVAAIRFYEAHGFQTAGQRRGYYSQPPDDAVLLSLLVADK